MINSIKHKMSVRIAAGAVGVAMIVSGLGVALPAAAAGLTSSQIQSILSLLQSFGADQATINNVNAALNGQATTGTSGSGSMTTGTGAACYSWSRNLTIGSTGADVQALQMFLNTNAASQVAATGAGSPGSETQYFGSLTQAALAKWQAANNVAPAAGYFGPITRAAIAAQCTSGTTGGSTTGGSTTGATGSATVSAAAQPANAIAPAGASRVPFTNFTVTAGASAVTINSVTVQRQGPSQDTDFGGVVLVDASTGVQLGTARVLDANHNATIGTPITIPAGTSKTFTVAGNIASSGAGSGDVASFAVTAINTSATVSGTLPITGASNTINTNLTIGSATIQTSSYDPAGYTSKPVGTTGYRFTGIKIQAGATEDVTLKSITWYQSGSASGLSNVMTVANGTSYPTTVDSTGRYYTTVFPNGIVIPKGQNIDVYIQADLGANTTANTYAEFDIYRNTDIYMVGNTYGYGITPTDSGSDSYSSSSQHATLFMTSANATPWIQGSTVTVTAGTFSTIQNATSVGAQNIAINVPNQPLGGFQTNLTGEGVQSQALYIHFTTSSAIAPLQNVSLVDENGSVVAGPFNAKCASNSTTQTADSTTLGTACGADYQFVDFTGAVNFPTGTHTYTVEGQLYNTVGNGVTIQANTDPSNDWSNVTGMTTGNVISLGVSNFTMNTMTVQAPALTVSNGTTPTSQTIVAGGQGIQFATIQLDASQSGEDVRVSSIPMAFTHTNYATTSDMSNCQLWDGSTALNTGSNVVNSADIASTAVGGAGPATSTVTFSLDNSLTIPKGTVKNLSLTCNVTSSASADGTYKWSAGDTWTNIASGAVSGKSVSISTPSNTGPTMTVASAGSLAISTDPSSPAYALVAGGSTGQTMDVIKFRASNEAINLQKLGLKLTNDAVASSSASDLTQVYIYAGNNVETTGGSAVAAGTLLGSMIFTGSNTSGTSTLTQVAQLPVNTDATLVIKADTANIGTNQPGTEGHLVKVDYLNSQGVGANSGTQVNSSAAASDFTGGTSAGIRTFKTVPTVAAGPSVSASPNGNSSVLKKFSITAGSQGGIGLNQLSLSVSTSTGVTLTQVKLFAYTDNNYSQPANVPGTTGGQFGGTKANITSGSANVFSQSADNSASPLEIGAGQTIYFTLVGNVSVSGQSTWSVNTTLNGDSAYPSLASGKFMAKAATLSGSSMVWSPNATTTVGATGIDWTNGYSVPGLPSTGL